MLYDIDAMQWSDELTALFGVPTSMLPEVRPSAGSFGETTRDVLGSPIPICGVAGDQQAALFGQGCWTRGSGKNTYGTGAFLLLNAGAERPRAGDGLLTTIACDGSGAPVYALEAAIFVAGAAVQWLRDKVRHIEKASGLDALAAQADPAEQLYLVPAFVGLGAPWWDAQARGAVFGLTRNSGAAELARATVEAVGYQTRDLIEAMHADWPSSARAETALRVDGGMTASDLTMQFLADILASPVDRPVVLETTALGAAYLAGRAAGLCPDLDGFAKSWKRERRFEPRMPERERAQKWAGWQDAVRRTLTKAHS
jgi:glycerol kinase